MIYPMRPTLAPPSMLPAMTRTIWAHEAKLDGDRRVIETGPVPLAWNRHLRPARVPPGVRADLEAIPHGLVLDGELVGPVLHLFDLVPRDGSALDYTARRRLLVAAVPPTLDHVVILPEWSGTYEEALDAGHEGLVLKKRTSLYYPGRHSDDPTTAWIKVRRKAP